MLFVTLTIMWQTPSVAFATVFEVIFSHIYRFWNIFQNCIHGLRWLHGYILCSRHIIQNCTGNILMVAFIVHRSLSHLFNDLYRQPIPRRHQNGEMLEYIIRAETNNTQYDDVRMTFSPDKRDGVLLNDINHHSSYNLSIRGRNTAGWSPHNDMVKPSTEDGECCCQYITLAWYMISHITLSYKLSLACLL